MFQIFVHLTHIWYFPMLKIGQRKDNYTHTHLTPVVCVCCFYWLLVALQVTSIVSRWGNSFLHINFYIDYILPIRAYIKLYKILFVFVNPVASWWRIDQTRLLKATTMRKISLNLVLHNVCGSFHLWRAELDPSRHMFIFITRSLFCCSHILLWRVILLIITHIIIDFMFNSKRRRVIFIHLFMTWY